MKYLSLFEAFDPSGRVSYKITFIGCLPNAAWNAPASWPRHEVDLIVHLDMTEAEGTFDLFGMNQKDLILPAIRLGDFEIQIDETLLEEIPMVQIRLFNKERLIELAHESKDIQRFSRKVERSFHEEVLHWYINHWSVSAMDSRSHHENDINDSALEDIMLNDGEYPQIRKI
jgi:hypothetical protein